MDAYARSVKKLGEKEDGSFEMGLLFFSLEQAFCLTHQKMLTRALNVRESTKLATWSTLTGTLTILEAGECWNS